MPALEALLNRFEAANTQPLGISVDSIFCHANWAGSIGGITFPLLADFHPKGAVADSYGLYLDPLGITDRATVIVDSSRAPMDESIPAAVPNVPTSPASPVSPVAPVPQVNAGPQAGGPFDAPPLPASPSAAVPSVEPVAPANPTIALACPACGSRYRVPQAAGGKRTHCKKCNTLFEIPVIG